MLVGLATTLAHELGVFQTAPVENDQDIAEIQQKKLRIRRLLYLYVSQLTLRLGCTTVFPSIGLQAIAYTPPANRSSDQASVDRELLLSKWIDLTQLLVSSTDILFGSWSSMKDMLKNSRYVSLIDHFQTLLVRWEKDFDNMKCPSELLRTSSSPMG